MPSKSKAIPGFLSYELTEDGDVWSNLSEKWLVPDFDLQGYARFLLKRDDDKIKVHVKRSKLMMLTFGPTRPFDGAIIRHLNDIKNDDRITNLAWGTHAENAQDAIKNGRLGGPRSEEAFLHGKIVRGEKMWTAKLTNEEAREIFRRGRVDFEDPYDLAEEFNLSVTAIKYLLCGKTWNSITGKLTVPSYNIRNYKRHIHKGELINTAKLTEAQVREIKITIRDKSPNINELAKQYGCSRAIILNIASNKTWKHVIV